jgi:hypothetical protein
MQSLLAALGHLPDDAQITITVRKADLVDALESAASGPAVMTTLQAEKHIGLTSPEWRRACEKGLVDGAEQDESGRWRFPKESAIRYVKLRTSGKKSGGLRGPRKQAPVLVLQTG